MPLSVRQMYSANAVSLIATALVVMGLSLLAQFWRIGRDDYVVLHALLENAAMILGVMSAVTLLHAPVAPDRRAVLVACLFAAVSLDLGHVYTHEGMSPLFSSVDPNKSLAFSLAARGFVAIGVIAMVTGLPQAWASGRVMLRVALLCAMSTGFLYWLILFASDRLPLLFSEAYGPSSLAVAAEYLLLGILAAAGITAGSRHAAGGLDLAHFLWALGLLMLGDVAYTLFSQITDATNLAGHVFKVAAYLLLYGSAHHFTNTPPSLPFPLTNRLSQQMIEGGPAAMLALDQAGLIAMVNDQLEDLSGHARAELMGQPLSALLPEPALAAYAHQRSQHANTHRPWRLEFPLPHKNGMEIDVEGEFRLIVVDQHEYVAAAFRRSPLHKQLREKLDRQHMDVTTLLENSPDMIARYDPQLRHAYVNAAFERLTGLQRIALIGRTWEEAGLATSPTGQWLSSVRRVFQRNVQETITVSYPIATVPHFFEMIAVPERNQTGQVATVLLIGRDITRRKSAESTALRSERYLAHVQEASALGSWRWDLQTDAVEWSSQVEQIFGHAPELASPTMDAVMTAVHPEDRATVRAMIDNALSRGTRYRVEHRIIRSDGVVRVLEVTGEPVLGIDGETTHVEGTVEDITEKHHAARERIRLSEIVEMTPDVVTIMLPEGRLIYLNGAGRQMFGLAPNQPLDGIQLPDLQMPAPRDGEVTVQAADGREVPMSRMVLAHHEKNGQLAWYSVILRDLTERKRYEADLLRHATHDPLTGLPNRALFGDRLEQAVPQADRRRSLVGVMFIDLDLFKHVNDTLGHAGGDRLLVEISRRLQHRVRPSDTVSRQGGDEFMVLLQEIARNEDLPSIAEKLLASIADEPFNLDGHRIHLSASIGISIYPTDGADADTLMRQADQALHRAKADGRNTYRFFAADMGASVRERIELEEGLRNAIEQGQLFVQYQPRACLATGRITGMEALVRWRKPGGEVIPPSRFIPIAEETGLIEPIGEFVLREVCCQIRAWHAAGLTPRKVAVNLSARQFQRPNLTECIKSILRESDVAPESLELEVTESMVMQEPANAIRVLQDLKDIGVTLAMDDFGTGYSSFSYLKHFPLDVLKIDRSFIVDVTSDPRDAGIVRAIVDVAKNLGMVTVAEGGETEAQCAFLKTAGVDELQGYYFSRPVSPEVMTQMLQSGHRLALP